jgi:integrase
VFNWAHADGLIVELPRYGTGFQAPSGKTLRVNQSNRPARLLSAEEIRQLSEAADATMRAAVLLGINCGLGNRDLGTLPRKALDLAGGWMNFARGKTGVGRRCPLWAETVKALKQALAVRPAPAVAADADLVFLQPDGKPFWRPARDEIGKVFGRLLVQVGIQRRGVRLYSLRHTFRTVADGAGDQRAAGIIMGHTDSRDISAVYVNGIEDTRLQKVAQHVHDWLFPVVQQAQQAADTDYVNIV